MALRGLVVHPAMRIYREPAFRRLAERGFDFLFTSPRTRSPHEQPKSAALRKSLPSRVYCARTPSFDLAIILKYDVVIFSGQTSLAYLLFAPLLKALGRKVILFEEHWHYPLEMRRYRQLFPYVRFLVRRCTDSIIVPGSKARELLCDLFGVRPEKIFTAYNTIPRRPLRGEDSPGKNGLRDKIESFAKGRQVVLYLGAIVEARGLDVLVRALALLPGSACLLVVGDGKFEPFCRLLVTRLGLDDRVRFMGACRPQDRRYFFQSADVFVLPAKRPRNPFAFGEPWGFTLNEAMSYGVAAVATNAVGAAFDLIRPEETGLVVRENHTPALMTAVGRLLADEAFRKRLAESGRRHVDRNFGEEQNFLGFYSAVSAACQPHASTFPGFRSLGEPAEAIR